MTCSLTTWAPWTSILRIDVLAGGERRPDLVARRAVPVAVDLVRLEEAAAVADPEELVAADEVVVDAVDLAGPRRPGRDRDDVVAASSRPRSRSRRRSSSMIVSLPTPDGPEMMTSIAPGAPSIV